MDPSVTLFYRSRAPSHFVARLGPGGWCEGWGWTAEQAVAALARVIGDVRPAGVPERALASLGEAEAWLRRRTPEAVLDDD